MTDGINVVKGEKFTNDRTVGNYEAVARLYGSRDVDELLLLDVTARSRGTTISAEVISYFANQLNIPLSVGGGIDSLSDASTCFRNGVEKIVLSTSAFLNPSLIYDIANIFGSQALILSLDFKNFESKKIMVNSGQREINVELEEIIERFEKLGAGEFLLQSCANDGTMMGMDFEKIKLVRSITNLPIIASSGAGSLDDFLLAIECGASAVAAGAIFQFTEITPKIVTEFLSSRNIEMRRN